MKKDITIFIGGSVNQDVSDNYKIIAEELGNKINERDYKIVFDGCSGLPSLVFEKITGYNRATICYTGHYCSEYTHKYYDCINISRLTPPSVLRSLQLKNQSEMTDTVISLSDAFVFMKGQMGTLEEIFRVINGKKNNEHDKPIVILNVNQEWDDLIGLLSSCNIDSCYYVTDNVVDCFNYVESELFKDTSYYYKLYVARGCAERSYPIVEKINHKKTLK